MPKDLKISSLIVVFTTKKSTAALSIKLNTYTIHVHLKLHDWSVLSMPSLLLYYIVLILTGAKVCDAGRGNHSSQVANASSSWAEGVEPCPLSSEQPLRLLSAHLGMLY